jgi:hypothetical protein
MSGNQNYVYSVSIYREPEDEILGEGRGPASHVISSLHNLIAEIERQEAEHNKFSRPEPGDFG